MKNKIVEAVTLIFQTSDLYDLDLQSEANKLTEEAQEVQDAISNPLVEEPVEFELCDAAIAAISAFRNVGRNRGMTQDETAVFMHAAIERKVEKWRTKYPVGGTE